MSSNMAADFTVISTKSSLAVAPDYEEMNSAKAFDFDVTLVKSLREHFPKYTVTTTYASNVPLLSFADVEPGIASYALDIETDSIFRYRSYLVYGELGESRVFAKYIYHFEDTEFIVFIVDDGIYTMQYILKEPDVKAGETPLSNCAATDALLREVGLRFEDHSRPDPKYIYLFEHGYWTRSKALWEDIHSSTWEKVILPSKLKKDLKSVTSRFFDSKDIYDRYGVPWKRGLIFYGPPGNGKTISIKALMRDLAEREKPIASLYVRTATDTWDIEAVFSFARYMTPCLLVLEDVDSIVNEDTRSYFFNEIDGLANNDGIMMAASTNFINKLDPGLAARPSRFDRKFKFPLPNPSLRVEYAAFWRRKLEKRAPSIDFPKLLLRPMARITGKFSFAFMQEAFISSLLQMARDDEDDRGSDDGDQDMDISESEIGEDLEPGDSDDGSNAFASARGQKQETRLVSGSEKAPDPLDKYHLWRAFKASVETLRKDLEHRNNIESLSDEELPHNEPAVPFKDRAKLSAQSKNGPSDFFSVKSTDERIEFMPSEKGGKWIIRAHNGGMRSRNQAAATETLPTHQLPHGVVRNKRAAPHRSFPSSSPERTKF